MDWKYKQFNSERTFQAPRYEVFEAARAFVAESLRWQIAETADGFEARGYSFFHAATAKFRIEPAAGGTKVALELVVERASALGFMLFDVGGYYNIQIRKWFDSIQWCLRQRLTSGQDASENPVVLQANKPTAYIFNGCLVFICVTFTLYLVFILITAVIGLLTGHLYTLGRGRGTSLHGAWARIVSAIILILAAQADKVQKDNPDSFKKN
jgi:hypothetical protein